MFFNVYRTHLHYHSQESSVTQSCPTLCSPKDCSMPGLPVHHQLLELTQTHVHCISDAIKPYYPLSSPSPPALSFSQHQGLFQWFNSTSGGQSNGVSASALVLPLNSQDWFPLKLTGWIFLLSKGLSRVFSSTTVQKLYTVSKSKTRSWLWLRSWTPYCQIQI